jgi:hypothetical protein
VALTATSCGVLATQPANKGSMAANTMLFMAIGFFIVRDYSAQNVPWRFFGNTRHNPIFSGANCLFRCKMLEKNPFENRLGGPFLAGVLKRFKQKKSPGNFTFRAIQCVLLFSNSRVYTGDVRDPGGFVYYVTGYT